MFGEGIRNTKAKGSHEKEAISWFIEQWGEEWWDSFNEKEKRDFIENFASIKALFTYQGGEWEIGERGSDSPKG